MIVLRDVNDSRRLEILQLVPNSIVTRYELAFDFGLEKYLQHLINRLGKSHG